MGCSARSSPLISTFGLEDAPKALESRTFCIACPLGRRLEWNIPYLIPPPPARGADLARPDPLRGRTASDRARRLPIETLAVLVP